MEYKNLASLVLERPIMTKPGRPWLTGLVTMYHTPVPPFAMYSLKHFLVDQHIKCFKIVLQDKLECFSN